MQLLFYWLLLTNIYQEQIPVGTIKVGDFFVDKTEIQNIHWLEYLHYERLRLDSSEYLRLLPSPENRWYTNPDLRYRPIVYINREQAISYCSWRSEVVSEKFGYPIKYSLPSVEDWKKIAREVQKSNPDKYDKVILRSKNSRSKKPFKKSRYGDNGDLSNLFDRLFEMTQEEGQAVGLDPDSIFNYLEPSPNIGFRCIVKTND